MEKIVNLTVPKSWSELTQEQLRYLLRTMVEVQRANSKRGYASPGDYASQCAAQVATLCFLKWSGLKLLCAVRDGWLVAHGEDEFTLTTAQLAGAIAHLAWAKELPHEPVRLDEIDGARAVAADLSAGFSFNDWLSCETLWQAYQLTSDDGMLRKMAAILYGKEDINPDEAGTLGVFYWWASVKTMVSGMFPH
ncbi:MAG: hypothetical protein NC311_19700, partial [Muribaculaceae bacterium]|nr:hypothetical protein [Muribaculaceae bacterium]